MSFFILFSVWGGLCDDVQGFNRRAKAHNLVKQLSACNRLNLAHGDWPFGFFDYGYWLDIDFDDESVSVFHGVLYVQRPPPSA